MYKNNTPLTEAQEELLKENMGLVGNVLSHYIRDIRLEYEDAYQLGCMGLVEAIRTYNPSRGIAFSTFATRCIYFSVHRWALYNNRQKNSFGPNTALRSLDYREQKLDNAPEVYETFIPADYVSMEDRLIQKELVERIKEYIATFPKEAQYALWSVPILRVRTAEQVGATLGISAKEVRAMIKKYIRLLRIFGQRKCHRYV